MKVHSRQDQCTVFELSEKEKALFEVLVRLYPLVPPAHHQLTRQPVPPELSDAQKLLDEALAEQRESNRRRVEEWLASTARFQPVENAYRLTLEPAESDWLLEILNDVRVGSWMALGSPDYGEEPKVPLNDETVKFFWALDMSGAFQSCLLQGLDESGAGET